jgi:hypothetical protein
MGFGREITTPDKNFSLSQALWQGDETKFRQVCHSHLGVTNQALVQCLEVLNLIFKESKTYIR